MGPFEPLGDVDLSTVSAVCIGTGRFLRAVLVPALSEIGCEVVLAQTRGKSFPEYMMKRLPERTYEVDTVLQDGRVLTTRYPVAAVGSLGDAAGRAAFMALPSKLKALRYVGLGLTEAGITHNGKAMNDLAEFLHACMLGGCGTDAPLCLINTDNVPFNGDAIAQHVGSCDFTQSQPAESGFVAWLASRVVFHNTMVDRITSHRDGDADVPRAEPLPAKALVIEDPQGALPAQMGSVPGVVVRTAAGQLQIDVQLKLRVANGALRRPHSNLPLERESRVRGTWEEDLLPTLPRIHNTPPRAPDSVASHAPPPQASTRRWST